jgi:hypothetical protein
MPALRTLLALVVCVSCGLAADGKLHVLGKKDPLTGELVSIDDARVVLKVAGKDETIPTKDILRIELNPPAPLAGLKYIDVQLNDGTVLHCSQFVLKGKQAELTVLPALPLTIPLSSITYVLNEAHDPKVQKQWKDTLASKTFLEKRKGNFDMLAVVRQGSFVDLYGTLGDGDDKGETIAFELESGAKARPTLAKVFGLYFTRKALVNPPDTLCTVEDTHRNRLPVAKVSVAGGKCVVTTVGGTRIEYPDLKLLSNLDYRRGRLDYLSELEPTTVEVSSKDDRIETYRKDKNLDDGPIRLYGKNDLAKAPYKKGLVLLARTVLVYDLKGEYQKFEAVLGTDALVTEESQVKVRIEGDGAELFTTEVKSKEEPREVRLSIKDVQQLKIIVSSELLDLGNHVILADAKVSK